ncbi:MAG: hypothetical protein Q9213_006512, partial [Squamulea squamosa]
MASRQTLNNAALCSLLLLAFLGFWGTWGIGGRTGFLALIKDTLDAPVQLLPVVDKPVHHTYTGIPPVDALIRRLNVFLWPAIDGTWPGLCLVAWEFSGGFSASWMVVGLEGLRYGNRGRVISYTTIIGTLSQVVTYCTIMPLYLFLHVLKSPTNLLGSSSTATNDPSKDFLIDPAELAAWAPAFTLSYLLPTFLVMLPSPKYTSWTVHQYIMAVWEFYPVPFKVLQVVLARYVFTKVLASSSPSSVVPAATVPAAASKKDAKSSQSQPPLAAQKATNLHLLRRTYLFAASVAIITHIITLTLALSTYFFPSLFSPAALSNISLLPSDVFLPVSPLQNTPVKNLGEGLYHFLVWNMT